MSSILRRVAKMTGIAIVILIVLFLLGLFFVHLTPSFGGKLDRNQKAIYDKALNHNQGKFVNQIPTSMNMDLSTIVSLVRDRIQGNQNGRPQRPLPVIQVDPQKISQKAEDQTSIVWFGHSAFLLQMEGLNILIDPMLGNSPAPYSFLGGKRFNTTLPIKPEALPAIDVVVYSHDHYDHLDYHSVIKLKDKVGRFYVPLGVGVHLKAWGVPTHKIYELNWGDSVSYKNISFICTPARHFSGRGLFDRNTTLWSSWVIKSSQKSLYFSGDSGYGPHFKEIGEKYGPFDFAMLECGQYDKRWENIHMLPEQTVKAAQDIQAKLMMPIHWAAFQLALHEWKDPIKRVMHAAQKSGVSIITPKIGETVVLNDLPIITTRWWEEY